MVGGASELHATSSARISEAMSLLVDLARSAARFARTPIPPIFCARWPVSPIYTSPDWDASARRLIDILMDGLESVVPTLDPRGAEAGPTGSRHR